ncbi:hypothetical protein BU17DRAFT_65502 [Hysterangium stoloniferum]|nr:hypothetical protein BU17DRAFT_65502 [Hysterangium stoloniferum]
MILPKNFEWCTHPVYFSQHCKHPVAYSALLPIVNKLQAVVFLLGQRTANPNMVGYVNSGFWAGMAISRIGLGCIYRRMSSRAVKHLHCNFCLSPKLLPIGISLSYSVDQFQSSHSYFIFLYGKSLLSRLGLSSRRLLASFMARIPAWRVSVYSDAPFETHMTSMAVMSTVANIGNGEFRIATP